MLKNSLVPVTGGDARQENIIKGEGFRITVVTDRLFRIEAGGDGSFTDMPTQCVWFRDAGYASFETRTENERFVFVKTAYAELCYDIKRKKAVYVRFIKENRKAKISNRGNLKGTRRTLDFTFGAVGLENGLLSKTGVSVFDDSNSLLLNKDGTITPRAVKGKDYYIFAYGKDYRQAIKDFYIISGSVPLVPRFALGVWWSRYRKYTQEEYTRLIQRFEDENIPLTVATIDMDWHWTDLEKQFGIKKKKGTVWQSGWTGYSWNTELFPDYRAFLTWLKSKNLKITVNLHPSDGVRYFEDMYPDMARAMGVNPESKEPVVFDVSSPLFWNNYFDIIHKPYEREGVDFWWIDWQQGKKSQIEGLDPLWALNHYHYLDNGEDGRIPLTLSRYAKLGSHRYPLGFSGDTAINWRVFRFQPYFTANAANAGYTWWSHDIGGHHFGYKDEELYVRWLQFGVFSPIMRLHSTSNDLLGKEPWRFSKDTADIAANFLRLRHGLMPYLYTMDYRNHKDGLSLLEPMYYSYPNNKSAYKYKNQYMFGSELLVAPVISKIDNKLRMAETKVWVPKGRFTDIFTRKIYYGEQEVSIFSDISSIPVLAKEGAIIPMSADAGNSAENPKNLKLLVFRGDGEFTLYEDNGKTDYEKYHAKTRFTVSESADGLTFRLYPAEGDTDVLPKTRRVTLEIADILKVREYSVKIDGETVESFRRDGENYSDKPFTAEFSVSPESYAEVVITDYQKLQNPEIREEIMSLFSRWQANTLRKTIKYSRLKKIKDLKDLEVALCSARLPKRVKKACAMLFQNK